MLIVVFLSIIVAIIAAVYAQIYFGFFVLLFGLLLFGFKRKEYRVFLFLTIIFSIFFFYTFFVIQNKAKVFQEIGLVAPAVRLQGFVKNTYSYGFLYKVIDDDVLSGKEFMVYKKQHNLVLGDKVSVAGNLMVEKSMTKLELLSKPVASIFPRQIIKVQDSWLKWVYDLKNKFIVNVKQYLPEYYANFLIGLLIGVNGIELDSSLQDVFLSLGLLHMLVVSGAQVALLTSILLKFLSVFNLPKKVNFVVVLLFNVIFLLFVGGEISVLRAVIMMQITIFLNYDNRAKTTLQVLALTGIVMLIYSPGMLFSLSFILSFCATFSVVEISPLIQKMLEKNEYIPEFLEEPLGVSLGPILLTSPIIFLINRRFDVLALFANMLFGPVVEVVVIVGFMGMVLSVVCGLLAIPLLKFTFGLMVIMKTVADFLYSLPGRSVFFKQAFTINVAVYYLFVFTWLYKRELFRKYWSSFVIILISIIIVNFWFFTDQAERELYFYNRKDWFAVVYINKDKSLMIVSEEDLEKEKYLLKKIYQPTLSLIVDLQLKGDVGKRLSLQAGDTLSFGEMKISNKSGSIEFHDKLIRVNIIRDVSLVDKISGVAYFPLLNRVNGKLPLIKADIILLPCQESQGQIISTKKDIVRIDYKREKYHIY